MRQVAEDSSDGSRLQHIDTSQWLQSGKFYTTVEAPALIDGYRFTHWRVDAYGEEGYRDAWGRALNPVTFGLYEDTVATAHYLPEGLDSDGDGVPDWYKWHYFGTLDIAANSDLDGDGWTLAEEYASGRHPVFFDASDAGGVAYAQGRLVTFNQAGYPTVTIRTEPVGELNEVTVVVPGMRITTPVMADPEFGYWTLNGVRQADAWGRALRSVSFVVGDYDIEAIAWTFADDSDGDGLPDAWELYHLGTLEFGGGHSVDGSNFTLMQHYENGTDPAFAYLHEPGGVAWQSGELVTVNIAGYSRYTLRSEPEGHLFETAVVAPGHTITSPHVESVDFAYWEVDGLPQRDAWGVALRQIRFVMGEEDREAVAVFVAGDSDGDGLPDAWELYHLGTLAYGAEDSVATGASGTDSLWTLARAYAEEGSPLFARTYSPGGVARASGPLQVANLQIYPVGSLLWGSGQDFFHNPYTGTAGQFALEGGSSFPALADVDGDGDLDMLVGGTDGRIVFLRNVGSPFAPFFHEEAHALNMLPEWPTGSVYPVLYDWNGDGHVDLAVGSDDGKVRFYESTGTGTLNFVWVGTLATGEGSVFPAFARQADQVELYLLAKGTGQVERYAYRATGAPFASPASGQDLLPEPVIHARSIWLADTNANGHLDLLASDKDGRIWRFLGGSSGEFFLESKVWAGSHATFRNGLSIALADIDGDGDLDVIGGGTDGQLIYLRNPARHLRVSPSLVTVRSEGSVTFTSVDYNRTFRWQMGINRSGGTIDELTGVYTAGAVAGVDQVIVRNSAGRTGVAWINVLGTRAVTENKWAAVLVDGRRGPVDPVGNAAAALAKRAHEVLRYRGIPETDIQWLGHTTDANSLPTRNLLRSVLQDGDGIAGGIENLIVYLVDHGRVNSEGDGIFLLSAEESISGTELAEWLDQLQAQRPELSVMLVVESCYAGLITRPASQNPLFAGRRVTLASTGDNQLSHMAANGMVSYSMMWWSALAAGRTFGQAHQDADTSMQSLQQAVVSSPTHPLLELRPGAAAIVSSGRPTVRTQSDRIEINGTDSTRIAVEVSSSFAVEQVWGVVIPPGYQASGDTPVIDLPSIAFNRDPSTGIWHTHAGGFTEGGAPYTILLQARDVWGQVSLPSVLQVQQSQIFNKVILYGAGRADWPGAAVASDLISYAEQAALMRQVQPQHVRVMADPGIGLPGALSAGLENLQSLIADWAAGDVDGSLGALTLYLVGQGTPHGLRHDDDTILTPAMLKQWLDALQAATGAEVNVLVDSDYSGIFVEQSANALYRRVLASTTSARERKPAFDGSWNNITRWMWNAISRGRDMRQSFCDAISHAAMLGVSPVTALFDDSGDGQFDKQQDGVRAINRFVGSAYVTAADPPYIGKAQARRSFDSGTVGRFWISDVMMPDGGMANGAWAEILGPNGDFLATRSLWFNPAKNRFEGAFDEFADHGLYRAVIYAGDATDPGRTTPAVVVLMDYGAMETPVGMANILQPTEEEDFLVLLPLNGQLMDVESADGGQWRLSASRGQRLEISATNVAPRRDVSLRLHDEAGNLLRSVDDWGPGFGETISGWEVPYDGEFTVSLVFVAGEGAAYASVQCHVLYDGGLSNEHQLLTQELLFTTPATHPIGTPLTLSASASSGLPVRYAVIEDDAALSDQVLSVDEPGYVTVIAYQDGDETWDSALPVTRSILFVTSDPIESAYQQWAQEIFGADVDTLGQPEADPDGDGFTNLQEWLAGTHPLDPHDFFVIESLQSDHEHLTLRWWGNEGITYWVERSLDLTNWVNVPGATFQGEGGWIQFSVDLPDNAAGALIYRVGAQRDL